METNPFCPYCKAPLPKFPTAKTKCKKCGQFIYVRTLPLDKSHVVVTEIEASAIDKEKRTFVSDSQLFRWLPLGGSFLMGTNGTMETRPPIPSREPEKVCSLLEDIRAKHPEKSHREIHWLFMNALAEQNDSDLFWLNQLHFAMALYLHHEDKDPFSELVITRKLELQHYQIYNNAKKAIIIMAMGCSECKKLENKIYTIEQALLEMPIPNRNCTTIYDNRKFPICRCSWSPTF